MLSDELNVSVTPVRDALHRLTGERLVEAPRHNGFRAPLLGEITLRHLYAWHLDLLLLAIGRRSSERHHLVEHIRDVGAEERLNSIFAEIVATSGNPEHSAALKNLTERLAPYQLAERKFLDAIETEAEQIMSAIRSRDLRRLRASLVSYHRRRRRVVPELLAELRDDP